MKEKINFIRDSNFIIWKLSHIKSLPLSDRSLSTAKICWLEEEFS